MFFFGCEKEPKSVGNLDFPTPLKTTLGGAGQEINSDYE